MTFLTPLFLLAAVPCLAWFWLWRLPGRFPRALRLAVYAALVAALARPCAAAAARWSWGPTAGRRCRTGRCAGRRR